MSDTDLKLRKLVTELRDAAETALDHWTKDPTVRAQQIDDAIRAADELAFELGATGAPSPRCPAGAR